MKETYSVVKGERKTIITGKKRIKDFIEDMPIILFIIYLLVLHDNIIWLPFVITTFVLLTLFWEYEICLEREERE